MPFVNSSISEAAGVVVHLHNLEVAVLLHKLEVEAPHRSRARRRAEGVPHRNNLEAEVPRRSLVVHTG